jgi:peptide/nickel transport system substrate-binding protein
MGKMAGDQSNYWTAGPWKHLNRRRLLSGAALIAGGGLLAACGKKGGSSTASSSSTPGAQNAAGTPRDGGTLVATTIASYPLDAQQSSNSAQSLISGVQSRLFQFQTGADPKVATDHNVIPDLGLSVESSDAITWTVKLRNDVKWHNVAPVNGRPFDSEDVKATFTRALTGNFGNPNRGALSMIDPNQIQTPDKSTIVFKLLFPYAPFPPLMASGTTSWIFPKEALAGAYDPVKTVIGTGPFILQSATPDVGYIYKKNPDYFVKGIPHVDGIKTVIIADRNAQNSQFTAGQLDELAPLIQNLDPMRQQNPQAQWIQTPSATPMPFYPQEGDPTGPFYDIRIRRAVSMLIDRDALNKSVQNGKGINVLFSPLYMGKWSALISDLPKDSQQWYELNPQAAKQLLAAAGASNLTIKIGYVVNGGPSGPNYTAVAEAVASMVAQGGIKASLFTQDYNTQYINGGKGSRDGHFEKDAMILAGIGPTADADSMMFDNFSSKSTSNGDLLSDPALDAMIDKERTIVNSDARLKAIQDIYHYIGDHVFTIPTPGANGNLLINSRVQNYQYGTNNAAGTETYAKLWLKT